MERSFFEIFEEMEDPRHDKGKKYPLMDVIILALYGTLIGFEDFSNMSYYLKKREQELTEAFHLEHGVPSHDVFSDVFRLLNIKRFMELFVEWTKEIVQAKDGTHIAIDGKAVRAATEKAAKGRIPYVISAFMVDQGISIGQKEVGDKTNEITEIPKLLDLIDIKDSVITVDAIGTQTAIMDTIVSKGGHFCLQLKRNQPTTFDDVNAFFADFLSDKHCNYTFEAFVKKDFSNHGRTETRKYYLFSEAEVIKNMIPAVWKHVKCLGMAQITRDTGDAKTFETHFHVLDFVPSAEEYAGYARGHWAIENNLHWVLDVHFREDASTANKDGAISNLALLRKIAFNLTKLDPNMKKKSTKKRMIDFLTDTDLFCSFIYDTVPRLA